ncbi:MAG: sigma-54-dependent Fis family transcriptional regulator [Acidobacteria bacterium]|nr:sigma-54-dependent Fis family transcriptional regulator [Acidobacteriota bacterium]
MQNQDVKQGTVILVDDDSTFCLLVKRWVELAGYKVEVFGDGESCLAGLGSVLPSVVCLDLTLPSLGGLEVLQKIKELHRHLPVIILTANTSIDTVVTAMQLGSYDYLVKPVDRTKLVTTIKNAVEHYQMSLRLAQLEREVGGIGYPGIIGNSPAMKRIYRQVDQVATSDITVLVHGESGTGKELIARAIHSNSGRAKNAFIALNCAAIPEALQESELFGHERGSFTGALNRRLGKFEQADGGTLFLDEVAELSLGLQAKLLRVLQEKSYQRLGGSTELRSDFRLVAATHRNLADEVKAGRFRDDLYFRIAVFELELPPLRERREDILLLAQNFLQTLSAQYGGKQFFLSTEAIDLLMNYAWPGNVRELQNSMQRAFVTATGENILPSDLPSRLFQNNVVNLSSQERSIRLEAIGNRLPNHEGRAAGETPFPIPYAMPITATPGAPLKFPTFNLEELERLAIEEAIKQCGDNMSEVIRRLGIGRTTFYRKLKEYNLCDRRRLSA